MAKRILVIDSDESFANVLAAAISKSGLVPLTATNSEHGMTLAKQESPDLIVVCVEAQPTNGYMLCTRLKKDEKLKSIPVILTSANATPDSFEKHKKLKTRAEDYLIKPFPAAALIEKASALVGIEVPIEEAAPAEDDESLGLGHLVPTDDEPIRLTDDDVRDAAPVDEAVLVDDGIEEVVQLEESVAEGDSDMEMFDQAFESLKPVEPAPLERPHRHRSGGPHRRAGDRPHREERGYRNGPADLALRGAAAPEGSAQPPGEGDHPPQGRAAREGQAAPHPRGAADRARGAEPGAARRDPQAGVGCQGASAARRRSRRGRQEARARARRRARGVEVARRRQGEGCRGREAPQRAGRGEVAHRVDGDGDDRRARAAGERVRLAHGRAGEAPRRGGLRAFRGRRGRGLLGPERGAGRQGVPEDQERREAPREDAQGARDRTGALAGQRR